jgi:hypothetical protein
MNAHPDQNAFIDSAEHKAALAAQDAKRAMQILMKMSEDAQYRDALIPVLDDLYLVRVAISVVTERVETRDAA